MKRACVLLPGPVANDGRVIRTIRTMREHGAQVDLCFEGDPGDGAGLFDEGVALYPVRRNQGVAELKSRTKIANEWNISVWEVSLWRYDAL